MTRPLRALVVDDEPPARDELSFLLSECENVEVVGTARDAKSALALAELEKPDSAFIDLRMPGPDGIALAQALLLREPSMAVVVVSAHHDGALRAFDASVVDYLLKPVRLPRLKQALERIRSLRIDRENDMSIHAREAKSPDDLTLERLAVRRKGVYVVIDISEVICFEVRDEFVWAVTHSDRYSLDLTLSSLERRVPKGFFRSHRTSLVRIDKIVAIEPTGGGTYELRLDHPEKLSVPLARERVRALREHIPFAG